MTFEIKNIIPVIIGFITLLLASCSADSKLATTPPAQDAFPIPMARDCMQVNAKEVVIPFRYHTVEERVTAGGYFDFIDALVPHLDSTTAYSLDEYVIMRANPWLIEKLADTDYYRTAAKGEFVEDPKAIEILAKGDSLLVPSADQVRELRDRMEMTVIDVNIPEFKLRIKEGAEVIYEADVRVGKNTQRYLAMAGREVDLRTRPGVGEISRIARNPAYINPRNNKRYAVTRRDDKKVTKLPRIPWLEPTINGTQYGHLIHPTTNIGTLGKAYSNGCVGTSEADAWIIYFHAPLGTKVQFRYDLEVIQESGDTLRLKDIYPGFKATQKKYPVYASFYSSFFEKLFSEGETPLEVCACDIEG